MTVCHLDSNAALELTDVRISMVSANINVVFVTLDYEADLDSRALVEHLHTMCRRRHRLHIDGIAFSDWLARCIPGRHGIGLATDVLQTVRFINEPAEILYEHQMPTPLCQSIVSREWSEQRRETAVALPSELNSSSEVCFAHGRGVVVTAGHESEVIAAALMTILDLLFAAAEVRRIRRRLSTEMEGLRYRITAENHAHSIAELRRLIIEIRQTRLTLALDVIPAVAGVDSPDRVLDSVRGTFAQLLAVSPLIKSAQVQLSTLSEVVETSVTEQELATSARFEARQRQWQFWVSVLSGLIVPFALLLSYFGTGTQSDVQPATSMWDLERYWPAWTLTSFAVLAVIAVSGLRYWRWLRHKPSVREGEIQPQIEDAAR